MPVELEFKYVLRSPLELESRLLVEASNYDLQIIDINQGYLSKGGRIRSKTYRPKNGRPEDAVIQHIFTYKHRLSKRPGALEIECDISPEDFNLAWEDSDHHITKTRYVISCNDHGIWEIDFFRHKNKTYLAMAEFEVQQGIDRPLTLHPLVEEYLLFAVPEADDRFNNRKLSDHKKVAKLLKEIA